MKKKATRAIDPLERLKLWVKSGGRCAYPGCTNYLLKDNYTGYEWPIGDMAHIAGHSDKGPRSIARMSREKRNLEKNLILLCPSHHRIVDKIAKKYGIAKVLAFKRRHEDAVHYLTGLSVSGKTTIVRLKGLIRKEKVAVTDNQIREAVINHSAMIPDNSEFFDIALPDYEDNAQYWKSGCLTIDQEIAKLNSKIFGKKDVSHISVFAIARIPMLVYLGSRLSDKIPTDIYQKHRDGAESWCWKKSKNGISFSTKTIQKMPGINVAAILSLSGKINISSLPKTIRDKHSIYEIHPDKVRPTRDLVSTPRTLEAFRVSFQKLLRKIESAHPRTKRIALFPAIPVSAAIACGRELLKDISPSLMIYDFISNEYKPVLEVSR